jgi:hypothetical protein
MNFDEEKLEKQFITALKHHLKGWRAKVTADFSEKNFQNELAALNTDPIYPKFNFNTPEYVNIRFMGRMSISIGRRLGEIYDKIPRLLAAARYSLTPQQVAPRFDGLELDIALRYSEISNDDARFVRYICKKHLGTDLDKDGVGIEIRYNFNPNDSSRLRKDVDMANKVIYEKLTPVYLIFSSISPRDEAIARLMRAGWIFLVGENALSFATELLGLNIASILDRPSVRNEIKEEIDGMMKDIKESYSFMQMRT